MKKADEELIEPGEGCKRQEEGIDELDSADLESVAGGTNWHPQKDESKPSLRWNVPDEW